ncbi:putative ATP-grasp-modified RiPP [Streptomyces sp. NPDC018045]|uniref:putative ATP-grasp-modified RiPP n=1 Tax=Streptomyces sp. NPDC018045 TaxID=3365037 RepID=UPI0037BCD778
MAFQQCTSSRPFALRLFTAPVTSQCRSLPGTYDPQLQMTVTADGTPRIATSYAARSQTCGGLTTQTEIEIMDVC